MTDTAPQPLNLEPIKARYEAATPGPWTVISDDGGYDFHGFPTQTSIRTAEWPEHGWSRYGFDPTDAAFIAYARTDVPALVAEVERLRRENASLVHGLEVAVRSMPS